jgi:hypothetical protein
MLFLMVSVMNNVPVFSPELVPLYLNILDHPLEVQLLPLAP